MKKRGGRSSCNFDGNYGVGQQRKPDKANSSHAGTRASERETPVTARIQV